MDAANGRVAVVTGGSRGIGLSIARALVERGDRVCITGRNEATLKEAVTALGPERAIGVPGKAHDEAHRAEVVERTMAELGRIDYLVNNVGTNPVYGPAIDADPEVFRKVFDINVVTAFAWIKQVRAAAWGDQDGAVVNVSSVAGLRPAGPIGIYGLTKAALMYLTAQLAVELGPRVRVNAVAPAVVKTVFATALYEGREDEVASGYPLRRLGVPEDVSSVVAFLLSDQASWLTGQTIVIDGGSSLVGGTQ